MPIWISRLLERFFFLILLSVLMAGGQAVHAEVIHRLPTGAKIVALTFDACESATPAFLDRKISEFLVKEKIPFTVFVTGRFAEHNREALAELSKLDFVEIENHSLNHDNHMERLSDAAIAREVTENDALLAGITGRHTRYFRFPAGNYSPRAVRVVEGLGYKVVHWSFASGDPVKTLTPTELKHWVMSRTRPGSILIFHINGRGWSTGEALPEIVRDLERHGYRFTTLEAMLQ